MDRDYSRRDDRRDDHRRDDRRRRGGGGGGGDDRDHRPRHEKDRSRSPPRYDRRDDRRRERSPPRDQIKREGQQHAHPSRDTGRGRDPPTGPASARGYANDKRPREAAGIKSEGAPPGYPGNMKGQRSADVKLERAEDEDEETYMQRIMGFGAFRTTKNTQVPGNDKNYAVFKVKKSEYRQYMNRTGGFNRPLSPSRM